MRRNREQAMTQSKARKRGLQTTLVHASRSDDPTAAVSSPIWQTTTFRAASVEDLATNAARDRPTQFYTRYGNPNHAQAARVIAEIEGGEHALVTSSGMAAVSAGVLSQLQHGDQIVTQAGIYAGTAKLFREVLPRYGIRCIVVAEPSVEQFERAITEQTKLIYLESPTNPLMTLTDLTAVAKLAQRYKVRTLVDNTFATPVNQRPLALGIDAVVHSATKYLGGHSDLTMGALVADEAWVLRAWDHSLTAGAIPSPFDSWLLVRGLRTLGLRVARQNDSALALASVLEKHVAVSRVMYPGLSSHPQHALAREQMQGFTGMLSFELTGGYEAAERFVAGLCMASIGPSLGGPETLVVHPAAMWARDVATARQGIDGVLPGLVRVSVGIEDSADILADFEAALAKV
jgi:methionine-gamma-lyase